MKKPVIKCVTCPGKKLKVCEECTLRKYVDDSDACVCGHNIHEHEAVNDCKCYVYGCQCGGFESDIELKEVI